MEIEKIIIAGCEMYRAKNIEDEKKFKHCSNGFDEVGETMFFKTVKPMLHFHGIPNIKIINNTNSEKKCPICNGIVGKECDGLCAY